MGSSSEGGGAQQDERGGGDQGQSERGRRGQEADANAVVAEVTMKAVSSAKVGSLSCR